MLTQKEWEQLCEPTHSRCATPWLARHKRVTWTVASNGKALLAVRGKHAGAGYSGPERGFESVVGDCKRPRHSATWSAFSGWAKKASKKRIVCPWCDGEPTDHNGFECDECDAKGTLPPRDWQDVFGVSIDRCLLWRYLSRVRSPIVKVALPTRTETSQYTPMGIFAEDDAWRVYVMPGHLCNPVGTMPSSILEVA